MSIVFKLKYRDITRRTVLAKLPEWNAIAERISSIFLVPVANVGVSYVDGDGEEITLNSQEELDDFYTTSYRHSESIRFTVKDISTSHSMSRDSHEFPPLSSPSTIPSCSLYSTRVNSLLWDAAAAILSFVSTGNSTSYTPSPSEWRENGSWASWSP